MGICESTLSTTSNLQINRKLGDEITLLAGQINAATYRFLKLIAEFDRREGWEGEGIKSCAHWLNWKCGIALGAAREKVRVARCLESLPKINKAFETGALSFSKVRAMTRVATDDNEDFLIMIARHGTASHMEQLVGKYKTVSKREYRQHEKQVAKKIEPERSIMSYQDDDGMWIIHAKLPAEEGTLVVKAIDTIMHEEKKRHEFEKEMHEREEERQQKDEGTKNVSAETSVKLFPYAKKRADALVIMAEHFLASKTNSTKTLAGSERCQIMLHVDLKTLQTRGGSRCNDNSQSVKHCNLDNKHWISPETARRLSCDASLVTVLEDDMGNVLNIGRRSRVIPPAIQRALALRDTSCRHPGCCSSNHLDAHHIKHWADGGETSLENLVMLCRHHHTRLHKGIFSIEVNNAEIRFIDANGKVMQQSFFPQFSNQSKNIVPFNIMFPTINKDTATSQWHGEKMDYDMAFGGLR